MSSGRNPEDERLRNWKSRERKKLMQMACDMMSTKITLEHCIKMQLPYSSYLRMTES